MTRPGRTVAFGQALRLERVPTEPARSWHEALQSFWFTHLALHLEQCLWSISAGRFDQCMWPFFRQDVEAGRLL